MQKLLNLPLGWVMTLWYVGAITLIPHQASAQNTPEKSPSSTEISDAKANIAKAQAEIAAAKIVIAKAKAKAAKAKAAAIAAEAQKAAKAAELAEAEANAAILAATPDQPDIPEVKIQETIETQNDRVSDDQPTIDVAASLPTLPIQENETPDILPEAEAALNQAEKALAATKTKPSAIDTAPSAPIADIISDKTVPKASAPQTLPTNIIPTPPEMIVKDIIQDAKELETSSKIVAGKLAIDGASAVTTKVISALPAISTTPTLYVAPINVDLSARPKDIIEESAPSPIAPNYNIILPGVLDLKRIDSTAPLGGCEKIHKGLTETGGFLLINCEKLVPYLPIEEQKKAAESYIDLLLTQGWQKTVDTGNESGTELSMTDAFGCVRKTAIMVWTDRNLNEPTIDKSNRDGFRQIVFKTTFKGVACEVHYDTVKRLAEM